MEKKQEDTRTKKGKKGNKLSIAFK